MYRKSKEMGIEVNQHPYSILFGYTKIYRFLLALCLFPALAAVCRGRHPRRFPKAFAKIAEAVKADGRRNLRNAPIGIPQEMLGALDAESCQVLAKGVGKPCTKGAAKMPVAEV